MRESVVQVCRHVWLKPTFEYSAPGTVSSKSLPAIKSWPRFLRKIGYRCHWLAGLVAGAIESIDGVHRQGPRGVCDIEVEKPVAKRPSSLCALCVLCAKSRFSACASHDNWYRVGVRRIVASYRHKHPRCLS